MSEDPAQNMDGSRSFEERVFNEIRLITEHVGAKSIEHINVLIAVSALFYIRCTQ